MPSTLRITFWLATLPCCRKKSRENSSAIFAPIADSASSSLAAADALRQRRVEIDFLAAREVDALHRPRRERVLGHRQARGLEPDGELLDLRLAAHRKVGTLVAVRPALGPGPEPERLDAFLQDVLGDGGDLRRRVRLVRIARRHLHRHLGIAARADHLDPLVTRHLVERLLQRLDVDDRFVVTDISRPCRRAVARARPP
jgi:hypothetical protein